MGIKLGVFTKVCCGNNTLATIIFETINFKKHET